jgi:Uma2 family endonuclease
VYVTSPRLTAGDLLRCGAPRVPCELWDGALVVREPAGGWAGEVAGRIHAALASHVRARRLGWTPVAEQGYWVGRDPDRVLAPDVAFVSRARCPAIPESGFIAVAPDFAVEVRSPTDLWPDVIAKCGVWIAHGTLVAWAVDPHSRRLVVLRPGAPAREAGPHEAVDASPALADFRLEVDDLYEGMD